MHVHDAGFYGAPRGGVSQSTLFLLEAYALGAADGVRLGLAVLLAVYGLAQLRPRASQPQEGLTSPADVRQPTTAGTSSAAAGSSVGWSRTTPPLSCATERCSARTGSCAATASSSRGR